MLPTERQVPEFSLRSWSGIVDGAWTQGVAARADPVLEHPWPT